MFNEETTGEMESADFGNIHDASIPICVSHSVPTDRPFSTTDQELACGPIPVPIIEVFSIVEPPMSHHL